MNFNLKAFDENIPKNNILLSEEGQKNTVRLD